jgi:FMN phosphatase YigB (HAD superfamily)
MMFYSRLKWRSFQPYEHYQAQAIASRIDGVQVLMEKGRSPKSMNNLLQNIDIVCFDLFGTLIEITDRQRPLARILRKLPRGKVEAFRHLAMTSDMSIAAINEQIMAGASVAELIAAQTAISHEVASVRLRPGIAEMLAGLPVPYGICSNLSVDYVPALQNFPEITPAFQVLSCFVGSQKPDPQIYDMVVHASNAPAERILFTGDTFGADVEGPQQAGMQAMLIDDFMAQVFARCHEH